MNYCQNCGSQCEDKDLFCKTCGTMLDNPAVPAQDNPASAPPAGGPELRPYNENFSAAGQNPPGNAPNHGSEGLGNTYNANPGYRYPNANINGGYNYYANSYGPQSPAYSYYNVGPKNNGFATASMVLGIVGIVALFCDGLGFFPAILAIIFSCVSKRAIKKSNGAEIGKGMATAGLILGIIAVAIVILIIIILIALAVSGIFSYNSSSGIPPGQTYST